MFQIKNDKHKKLYEIIRYKVPVITLTEEEFVALANKITEYIVGKGFIISRPNQEAKAKGYGKYHYIKGFILAVWHDIKKKYAIKRNKTI